MIRFLLDSEIIEISDYRADLTVLQFLRDHLKQTGTKEGCAAGDCGACTIVVADIAPNKDSLNYKTINSCIALLSSIHGKQLITVEHLSQGYQLHPVQQAMVEYHASQCGFCTPGFVMSLFSLYHNHRSADRDTVLHALSGNLCRCTGYRPIIEAAISVCKDAQPDKFDLNSKSTIERLQEIKHINTQQANSSALMQPTTREELRSFKQQFPNVPLVAGGTDLSLQITQKLEPFEQLINVSSVDEMLQCEVTENKLVIGAAVSLSDLSQILLEEFPQLTELFYRFASLPLRNQATLGGNIANASPIGDMPPVLLALGANIIADNGEQTRTIPIKEFHTGYKQTRLNRDEWITRIEIPKLAKNSRLAAYKISKRFEDDISAVCAVFNVQLGEDNKIVSLSSGFGGVAATPSSCEQLNTVLIGKSWRDPHLVDEGKLILQNAFTPIDDVRASANYRNLVLANLWQRFWLEYQLDTKVRTRVFNYA